MRIKHTPNEHYALYFDVKCKSADFKDYHFWHIYKLYSSKQAALNAIKRINNKRELAFVERLRFKIVWRPYAFADEKESIVVYTSKNEVKENEK